MLYRILITDEIIRDAIYNIIRVYKRTEAKSSGRSESSWKREGFFLSDV